jgi:hypothetical protein
MLDFLEPQFCVDIAVSLVTKTFNFNDGSFEFNNKTIKKKINVLLCMNYLNMYILSFYTRTHDAQK